MFGGIGCALHGSASNTSSIASIRRHRHSRNRRRRHQSRRSVKNRHGRWVTLPRPRPAQLATASATISQEDREKTREMPTQTSSHLKPAYLVLATTQVLGPTSQDDDLRAQVKALQKQALDETVSK